MDNRDIVVRKIYLKGQYLEIIDNSIKGLRLEQERTEKEIVQLKKDLESEE